MGKVVNVTESERKYRVTAFAKDNLWDREFIIYQWYDKKEKERKTKLIIDLLSLTSKWVRVTKKRSSNSDSTKMVEYLTSSEVDIDKLVGEMFVCKRRSLKGKISIDHFVRSNGTCDFLMEDEGDSLYTDTFAKENGMIIDDVTDDVNYRNTNMTTVFTMADKNNLLYLLNILFFPKKDGCPL
jgi:hypothetical protein